MAAGLQLCQEPLYPKPWSSASTPSLDGFQGHGTSSCEAGPRAHSPISATKLRYTLKIKILMRGMRHCRGLTNECCGLFCRFAQDLPPTFPKGGPTAPPSPQPPILWGNSSLFIYLPHVSVVGVPISQRLPGQSAWAPKIGI